MSEAKSKCLCCGRELMGRRDKKFCGDNCRATHNNELNRDANKFVNRINRILKKNRRILESLNPNGTSKVHHDRLLEQGFKFSYYTNEYKTKGGKVYKFCYEHGYLDIGNKMYALVLRKEYVE